MCECVAFPGHTHLDLETKDLKTSRIYLLKEFEGQFRTDVM